jgi:hypothetical protein
MSQSAVNLGAGGFVSYYADGGAAVILAPELEDNQGFSEEPVYAENVIETSGRKILLSDVEKNPSALADLPSLQSMILAAKERRRQSPSDYPSRLEGIESLREVLTENYPSEAVDRARRAYDRRAAEQMMDTEYLADVENLSGMPMNEGRGSVFAALGYHGSPGSDEGQVSISHYEGPMGPSGGRTLGKYIFKEPFGRPVADMSQEDIDREMANADENYNFYGDPPTVGGIALDASHQPYGNHPAYPDKPRGGGDYADTLYHELRHGGFDSEAFQERKDRLSEASVLSPEWKLYGDLLLAEKNQHAIYESIRQIQQGETTYDDLPERDRALLDSFANAEQALSDSFTERERLKLGISSALVRKVGGIAEMFFANREHATMDKRNNAVGINLFKKAGIKATAPQLTEMVDKRIFEQLNVILGRKPDEQGPPADRPQWNKNFRSPAEGPDLYFPRDNSGYFLPDH